MCDYADDTIRRSGYSEINIAHRAAKFECNFAPIKSDFVFFD